MSGQASVTSGERVVLSSYADVRDALRQRDLKQALYDAGGAVMADSLITLHGDEHKLRRRVENRLFRRGTFQWWELNLVPAIIADAFEQPLRAGRADLVRLGRRTIMYLTALVAGIDPPHTEQAGDALEHFAHVFSSGATAVHSTRDRDEVNAEAAQAMQEFSAMFLEPSLNRRQALLAELRAGTVSEAELPRDVLMALLRHQDELGIDRDVICREVAFYLQAGSHSTANLFTHAAHEIFKGRTDPRFTERTEDLLYLQRCVHETLRLHPASPVAWRRAMADIGLKSGQRIAAGTLVEMDLQAANTDPSVWGSAAKAYQPGRPLPEGVQPWGHSFGGGMHACIGMELDGGVPPSSGHGEDHDVVFGTVTLMLQALLAHGGKPDPAEPPSIDQHSQRENYSRYPVIFTRGV